MSLLKRLTILVGLALPAAAMAQSIMDANQDGFVSLDELQAVMPEFSSDSFVSIDLDGDALLSADEIAAAREAGVLPPEES